MNATISVSEDIYVHLNQGNEFAYIQVDFNVYAGPPPCGKAPERTGYAISILACKKVSNIFHGREMIISWCNYRPD